MVDRREPNSAAVRDYAVVTLAYWAFTLTDGALRTLVLLHLHELGFAPLEIASMFLAYEALGVVTNLTAGWLGARCGLRAVLLAGLTLQVLACGGLGLAAESLTVGLVLVAQAMSGVAKDLTKAGAKSYVKLVVAEGEASRLLRWVAVLTGSKNALKGVGLLLGGLGLGALGFRATCFAMAGTVGAGLVLVLLRLGADAGRARTKPKVRSVFSADPRVNWLSAARLFLFGSRDVWFVLAVPVYLREVAGWSFGATSGFLAAWIMGYGIVQASAPRWLGARREAAGSGRLMALTAALVVPLGAVLVAFQAGLAPQAALVVGLALYGVVFAADSALHSYLIVSYADRDAVAQNVGFYYTANATGRLVGTVLSGSVYQAAGGGRDGLAACIATSIGLVALSVVSAVPLRSAERRSHIGGAP
ncbi:MAG: organoarsenical effux MFS transporter ArsJ [Planctomycetota bacterium]